MSKDLSNPGDSRVVFTAVGACFVLSGVAALIYQTAWMRQLSTVFGTSELAVATVLAAYMGGLAFGAAIAARIIDRIRRPILTYGILEAAIAGSALVIPFLMTLTGVLYAGLFGGQAEPPDASGAGQTLFYLLSTFLLLLIPTACMGATLPMLTRYAVRTDEQVGPRVGALYALNTVGAIAGTLVAAFVLLPSFGLMGTIYVGAAVNLLVFVVAALLARRQEPREASPHSDTLKIRIKWRPESWILPVMLVSGVTTFAYEVLWTRLLSHVLGGSVIAFATMLASFLSGIAIGSAVAARVAKTASMARLAFVFVQISIATTSAVIFLVIDRFIPDVAGFGGNAGIAFALLLPATLFIGATYPLAVRILSRDERDAPVASARVYSWNTVGAIAGAIFAGFILIPALRYEGSIRVMVLTNLVLALIAAFAVPPRRRLLAGACAVLTLLAVVSFRPPPPEALLRVSPLNDFRIGDIRYYDVGRSATVVSLERDGYFFLRTNGLSEAAVNLKGAPPTRLSHRLLTSLPVFARPDTRKVMVVGFGGGVAVEHVPASVEDIDIVEIEPKVIAANRIIGNERDVDPLSDPRINVVINDARNALRLTDKKYDAIISQPSHPWTAGASHLYTREFMELARSGLSDDGVFLQWMNMQFVSESLLRSLVATLLDVFPHVRAYHVEEAVIFFLASDSPIAPEESLLRTGEPLASNRQLFLRQGIASVNDLVAALAWDQKALESLAAGAPLITDDHNLMATRSAEELRLDTFDYGRLKELIREYGPLFDENSEVHREMSGRIDFVYVVDRLSRMQAPELAVALTETLEQRHQSDAFVNVARVLEARGDSASADQALLRALAGAPHDPKASFLLLRKRHNDVRTGQLPERISGLVANLTPAAAAVIDTWGPSMAGRSDLARDADEVLATARPVDLWFLDATKLRADWRIRAAASGEDKPLAEEALIIIDSAIALYQNLDLFGMRMAAAYLAEDHNAVVETARRMVRIIRGDIETRLETLPVQLRRAELASYARRVQSIREGVASTRDAQTVPDYKFGNLDDELEKLLQSIERM